MRSPRSAVLKLDHVSEPPEISSSGAALVYVQVADHIAGRIASGELAPGSRLPAERDLATFYGVSYDTIRRATAVLRQRELIVTVHGRGTFVRE
jgi:GntR family transcriptional regulator